MSRNHPRPGNLIRTSSTLRDQALRYSAVLELIKTAPALKMREQIHAQLEITADSVEKASTVKKQLTEAKQLAAHTDAGFINGLRGLANLLQVADPKLYEKLPRIANLSKIDPDGFASAVVSALHSGGKTGEVLAHFVESAMEGRIAAKRALLKSQEDQMHLNKGHASVSDLKSLITAADSLIHNAVEPGSPLLAMLKPPRKTKKRGSPAHPGQPAPQPNPGATEGHVEPTHPAPVVAVNEVHPVGATVPQELNGAAHA